MEISTVLGWRSEELAVVSGRASLTTHSGLLHCPAPDTVRAVARDKSLHWQKCKYLIWNTLSMPSIFFWNLTQMA